MTRRARKRDFRGGSISDFFNKIGGSLPLRDEHLTAGLLSVQRAIYYVRSTSTPAVRFAHLVLKNSDFRIDHNSDDRWQP